MTTKKQPKRRKKQRKELRERLEIADRLLKIHPAYPIAMLFYKLKGIFRPKQKKLNW